MHTFEFCRNLRETPGEHTQGDPPKKTGIFQVKMVRN